MRKITSILLALSFVLVAITGIQMTGGHGPEDGKYLIERSSVQNAVNSGSTSGAAERKRPDLYPRHVHEWGGYLFIVAGLMHLGLNWRPMKSYMQMNKRPVK